MKLEINKQQYKALVKLIYWGEWLANSYKTKEDKIFIETNEIEQLIYSFGEKFKLSDWLEFDKEMDTYFPTSKMEEALRPAIDKYNRRQIDLLIDNN